MPRVLPAIAVASVAAIILSLSACARPTSAGPAPSSQHAAPQEPISSAPVTSSAAAAEPANSSTTSSSTTSPVRGDGSGLASKLLTGPVAGYTLERIDNSNRGPLTELESPYFDVADYQLDPETCDATGIEQLIVGSQAATEHEIVTVALGIDVMSPERHQQYAKKCAEVNGTVNGSDVLLTVEKQHDLSIDGASDVVTTATNHGIPYSEGDAGHTSYLITGNVGDTNVVVYSTTTSEGNFAGVEASFEATAAIFKAQVEALNA